MQEIRIPDTYEIIEQRTIDDLHSEGLLLRHKKTRARVALLLNDDENKVFYIGFRTPPTDSTGVAHIIEHTVLCGSELFPVKDPFIQLAKGSLNTFLNAMTYPDKTVYPVASCNTQDFKNLMHVYMDAVLHPNIYHDRRFFLQEGWRYEMQDKDDALTINGIVYNEMKGVMSAPDSVVGRGMRQSLFPDTEYGVDSGGDPDVIPDLTYEDYIAFHKRYYHPSNSYIYLYGDVDVFERLDWLDREYLSHYDYLEVDSMPKRQEAFAEARVSREAYSVMPGQSVKNASYLTYNVCLGDSLDKKLHIAVDVLEYALCDASGAILKQALIDKGIGTDVYCSYSDGILQPSFSIVARGTDADRQQEFVDTIHEVLSKIAEKGFDKKALYAGLNISEFQYREADFGRYPKGLMYGLEALDSWLFDDALPWVHIEAVETYAALKKGIEEGYFEELVKKAILDNPHKTIVSFVPEQGLTEKKDKALREALAARRAAMTEAEREAIVKATHDLKAWQETPDSEEDIRRIPLLSRADIKKEAEPFINEERQERDARILYHDVQTNGVSYLTFLFDMEHVPAELYPIAGLLKTVLGMVDTAHYGYAALANEISIRTGGFSGAVSTYPREGEAGKYVRTFEINVRVFRDHIKDGFDLTKEILLSSDFSDAKRIREILDEIRGRMQDDMQYSGTQTAILRALSHVSETAAIGDTVNGLTAYRMVEALEGDGAVRARAKLSKALDRLAKVLFRKENLLIDFTAPAEDYAAFAACAADFADSLFTDRVEEGHFTPQMTKEKEGFKTAGQVQFICRAGNFRKAGLPFNGRLRILKTLLSREYFWDNIRVKGGAYGCYAGFGRSGDSYFATYRDPHLKNSIEVFEKAADFIRSWQGDERAVTQVMLGSVSELDVPKTPSGKGSYGLAAYLTGLSFEQIQKDRDELLGADAENIRALAVYIDAGLKEDALCVLGSAEKIDAGRALFDTVDELIHDRDDAETP